MNNIIQKIFKKIIFVLFVMGLGLLAKKKLFLPNQTDETSKSKSAILKNYLLKFEKPQRIEVFGLSDRFSKEIIEIKKIKISQSKNSDFYITIQLFSDENDQTAPLIAQIRLVDLKSGNLKKEESINLE